MTAEPAPSRVVLVGFMGSGKTAVGRALAGLLGWTHLDLDGWIEAREGMPVTRIFAERGEPAFRALESEATRAAAGMTRVVVSTGGGWASRPEHWEWLHAGSLFVWLRAELAEALRRARAEGPTRPLLSGADADERARALLLAREPHYARADFTLDTDRGSPAALAGQILQQLRARNLPE